MSEKLMTTEPVKNKANPNWEELKFFILSNLPIINKVRHFIVQMKYLDKLTVEYDSRQKVVLIGEAETIDIVVKYCDLAIQAGVRNAKLELVLKYECEKFPEIKYSFKNQEKKK